ncbi:Lipase, GDSL [Cynara cardunculus var. scolymus]|uniref:Lipase, GDSL n=1 Tax=Cynara cardunculus var. scolymus TaxID=59895 RepID=A0A103XUB1_CYNCS|nr:Lipase, GDSL [Cynara cardunculus var. scolymus]
MSLSSSSCWLFFLIIIFHLVSTSANNGCYTSIISFGDSLADTGNLKQLASIYHRSFPYFRPPYGETFFGRPTGRCSNGRLIIDFLAESLGLPLVPPYVGGDTRRMDDGVNYAVAGATALGSRFTFASAETSCKDFIGRSLILVGEIGGNDYNHPLILGKSIEEVESYVPFVVSTIVLAINDLINLGAKTLVIPGNLPIGCSAAYLTIYYGSDIKEYDNTTGCLIRLNKFAEYHNELLQRELNRIQDINPNVHIIYADYYNAAMQFYVSPSKYGFKNGVLKACCGGEGPFNCNPSVACANPSYMVCAQPDTYANWDGMHLTEAAYKLIYKSVFEGSCSIPRFNSLCPSLTLHKRDYGAF